MLIRVRFLAVILAALPTAAVVTGCSKRRDEPRTQAEVFERKKSDQERDRTQQHDTAASSNESQQSRSDEHSGGSHKAGPFDQQSGGNGSSPGVAANNGGRAESDGAGGRTASGAVGETHSSKRPSMKSGTGSGYSSNGDPDYKPPSDPRAAQAAAEQALAAAEKAARSNDYGTAYRKALTGWQQANAYSKQDEKCRDLAQTLLKHLEQYGEKANQAAGVIDTPPPSYKTIILK